MLPLEQRRPLHGQRALPRQRLEEDPLLLGDLAGSGEREPERAEGAAGREQRQPDPGALVGALQERVDLLATELHAQAVGVLGQETAGAP